MTHKQTTNRYNIQIAIPGSTSTRYLAVAIFMHAAQNHTRANMTRYFVHIRDPSSHGRTMKPTVPPRPPRSRQTRYGMSKTVVAATR